MTPTQGQPRPVVIRHSLFARSEPFIPDQVAALPGDAVLLARDAIANPRDGLDARPFATSAVDRFAYTVLRRTHSLVEVIKQARPTVVHAHFGPEGMYTFRSARKLSLPHVTTLHGFDVSVSTRSFLTSGKPAWVHYGAGRSRFFRQRDAHFICVSEHVRRRAIAQGVSPTKIDVITTGVDTESVRPSGAKFSRPTLMHVARLVDKKGTRHLIDAMPAIIRRFPEANLIVVGDGPLSDALRAQVQSLGISASVEFKGALPHAEVLEHIRNSHVMCVPSITAPSGDQEGLPQVLLEGLAAGIPAVGTIHGGIPEAIVEGINGFLVPENSAPELAERIVAVLEESTSGQLSVEARRVAVERFNVHVQSQRLWDLYGALAR